MDISTSAPHAFEQKANNNSPGRGRPANRELAAYRADLQWVLKVLRRYLPVRSARTGKRLTASGLAYVIRWEYEDHQRAYLARWSIDECRRRLGTELRDCRVLKGGQCDCLPVVGSRWVPPPLRGSGPVHPEAAGAVELAEDHVYADELVREELGIADDAELRLAERAAIAEQVAKVNPNRSVEARVRRMIREAQRVEYVHLASHKQTGKQELPLLRRRESRQSAAQPRHRSPYST